MTTKRIFVGIDVAMAKGKRMPIAFLCQETGTTTIVAARGDKAFEGLRPPPGMGNAALVRDPATESGRHAAAVGSYIAAIAEALGATVAGVAIDAPASFRPQAVELRRAESALQAEGLSFFKTPSEAEFQAHLIAARRHLDAGGDVARLPSANLFWMLVGFALFRELRERFPAVPLVEVYPQATFWALGAAEEHKSRADGLASQLAALARAMDLEEAELLRALPHIGHGAGHDRLDALSAAWVASLPPGRRRLLGRDEQDGIFIPVG